jgi:hypothetical protein
VEKFQVSLKSGQNGGYFTRRPIHIFDNTAQFFLEKVKVKVKVNVKQSRYRPGVAQKFPGS